MKPKLYLLTILIAISTAIFSQNGDQLQTATLVKTADLMIEVPSIAAQLANGQFIPGEDFKKEVNPKKSGANKAVPGKGLPQGIDPLWEKQTKATKFKGKEPILTFQAASSYTTPTDPTGAVGPNHFVNAWNSSFRVWDKEGNPLTPAASLGTILIGNMGDPIVFYDQFADRFIITEFYSNGFGMAVCQGSDPVNDGWYLYQFNTNSFPDYPKFSLWSDGYYITANKNSGSAGYSEVVFAADREKMLVGDPSAQMVGFPLTGITTSGFYSPLGFNALGNTPPPAGNASIVYMQDDSWSGVSTDHLKIWTINVDWTNPGNSTISAAQQINTEPFDGLFDGGSFSNLPQPSGPDIDGLQATIMYMAQYRRFAGYNSAIFNFVVDLDGGDDYAGIRWYELRQPTDGDPWEIYQEGTYAQPDGHSAFSGAMCMDVNGNIGLAYTIVSNTIYPSLRFTGRFAGDPLGTMTLEEESFADGTQPDPSSRYGDYSQMTIDPVDEKTFWAIGEYFNGGSRKNQVGVFKIAADTANDVGIVSIDSPVSGTLTNTEAVTVTIRNFGTDSQSAIPISFQIDGGAVVNEIFDGPLGSNVNEQYTFTATGDFSIVGKTYEITVFTNLSSDENTINDSLTTSVTHLLPDDIGVMQVSSPVSDPGLSESEPISIVIKNFGGETQTNFDVTYILDGADPVTEQVAGPLIGDATIPYTFSTPGNFVAIGDHQLSVTTSLPGDLDNTNDTIEVVITKNMCQPETNCTRGDGFVALQLGSINNHSGCDPDGYGDYTDLITNLAQGSTNDFTVTTGYGNQHVKVWIDFDDNFIFEDSEIVIDDFVIAGGQGSGAFTETTQLEIPLNATTGEHLMRAKSNWNNPVPGNACEETNYGETEDYTVNVTMAFVVGIEKIDQEPNELIISTFENNRFSVTFSAVNMNDPLTITVHDIMGHTIISNRVENVNGLYEYDFDMSYAAPGVYLLRLGSATFGKIKKITVK
ncbi:MAG: GEVED domain-containing protein [Bacteroidales bacterium]